MAKNKTEKKMTLDKLAHMIREGFAGNDERFNNLDKRLDGIEFVLKGVHAKKIERIESDVKLLKETLAL